jgi:hypothetical protein
MWQHGPDCILDVRVTPAKVLDRHEKEKKRKYLQACMDQCWHFTPFIVSTDKLLGRKKNCTQEVLSPTIREMGPRPYSVVCGYVKAQMSISTVRATYYLYMRDTRLPDPNQPDQYSPTSVGGQSWSWPLSSFNIRWFTTKTEMHTQKLYPVR